MDPNRGRTFMRLLIYERESSRYVVEYRAYCRITAAPFAGRRAGSLRYSS